MNFATLKSLTIPEGSVKKITSGGVVLWEKVAELTNHFKPEQSTLNMRMGSSSLSALNGYVWSNAIPVNLTKETPFRVKVEGTLITSDTSDYQKIWLCVDDTGTSKLSAAILRYNIPMSSNYGTLLADGTIYADYKAGAKLSTSIINQTKYIRIGFKFSSSKINSADELKNVKITIPSDIGG